MESILRMAPVLWAPGYEATNDGRILGPGSPGMGPTWLRPGISSTGYKVVGINVDGKQRMRTVHSLVCEAFHGGRPQFDYQVRHLDGDKFNNHAWNLIWGTRAENASDKQGHGTATGGPKLGEAEVIELRQAYAEGGVTYAELGDEYDIDPSTVRRIVKRVMWKNVA